MLRSGLYLPSTCKLFNSDPRLTSACTHHDIQSVLDFGVCEETRECFGNLRRFWKYYSDTKIGYDKENELVSNAFDALWEKLEESDEDADFISQLESLVDWIPVDYYPHNPVGDVIQSLRDVMQLMISSA
jgi:hypothetical protein